MCLDLIWGGDLDRTPDIVTQREPKLDLNLCEPLVIVVAGAESILRLGLEELILAYRR